MDFKLGEGNVDGNGMFSKGWVAGKQSELFLFKGKKQKKGKCNNPHFLGLHTCDPAGPALSPVSMCILVFAFFLSMQVSLVLAVSV